MLALGSEHDAADVALVVDCIEEMDIVVVVLQVSAVELLWSVQLEVDHVALSFHGEGGVLIFYL